MKAPFNQMHNKHDMIRQFTPNWFAITMGTGVVAIVLAHFPILPELFYGVGQILWFINIVLFCLFSLLYLMRWLIYPQEAKQIFKHPSMSLFLGTIPMGLATIINGFLLYGISFWGHSAVTIAVNLWYADVILAVLVAWFVPFCMFSQQNHALTNMTAMWLLPIVAAEVAASAGGLILQTDPQIPHAVAILWSSYLLWGLSVLPAFLILAILVLRLALHQIPEKELAISSWLSIGPIGTGALAMLLLGKAAPLVLAQSDLALLGVFLQHSGIIISLAFMGVGIWWLGVAIFATLYHVQQGIPFNLGWWGLTFPLGVFTLALNQLAIQLNWASLAATASIFMLLLCMLWLAVSYKTIQGIYSGQLFYSPCLRVWQQQQEAS